MTPLLITSGEPAGVGPDLCLDLAQSEIPLVVIGDRQLFEQRAKLLNRKICFQDYKIHEKVIPRKDHLTVFHIPCATQVVPSELNPVNVPYVIKMLTIAVHLCLKKQFSGVVTAPIHKGVINEAGIPFTGHTEFFEEQCGSGTAVMMLACEAMKIALVTTHLPLRNVADKITQATIIDVIYSLDQSLKRDFTIKNPQIWVAGLNPHAGEGGHLGREEIDVIIPALDTLKKNGVEVDGPFSADTLFTPKNLKSCDVFVAMYHDQGLCVLKYAGFGHAVNITLGLPIVRTSVDHGTALELAGTGRASSQSLLSAVTMASQMVKAREQFS